MPSNATKVSVFDHPPSYAGDIIVYSREYQPRLLSPLSGDSRFEPGDIHIHQWRLFCVNIMYTRGDLLLENAHLLTLTAFLALLCAQDRFTPQYGGDTDTS